MHQLRALRTLFLATAATAVLTVPTTCPAVAADDGNTSITPAANTADAPQPFFRLDVAPGGRVRDRVVVQNHTGERRTYDLYAADATTVDGAFVLSAADAKPVDVGAWVRLPVRKVVLGPSQSRSVPFVLSVPRNATPGDHAGGIVALPRATQAADSSSNIRLRARYGVGVRLYVTANGATRPELTISKLTIDLPHGLGIALLGADSATVSYEVANSGNLTLAPQSSGGVTVPGRTIALSTHELGEMLPGGTSTLTERVDRLRWGSLLGRVHVRVTVIAAGAPAVTLEASAWRMPWLSLLGVAVLLLLAAGAWTVRRRRRRRRTEAGPVEAGVEEPDPVAS